MLGNKKRARLDALVLYFWTYDKKFNYAKNIIDKISLDDILDEKEQLEILRNASREEIESLIKMCDEIQIHSRPSNVFHTISGHSLDELEGLKLFLTDFIASKE